MYCAFSILSRNMSESLEEWEMLWEDKLLASVSVAFFKFSQTFMSVSIPQYHNVNSLCMRHHYVNSLC